MAKKYLDNDLPTESSWAETRDLKPLDSLLRKYGFKIHSRPRNGPATWIKDGTVLEQEDALLTLPPKEVSAARDTNVIPINITKKYAPN